MERQRRARINRCLDELKDILVNGLQSEGENVARLEKADILELTVRHLHKLQTQQNQMDLEETSTPTKCIGDNEKFRAGFAHCAQEVSRALASTPRIDIQVGTSLMVHLGHALNQISSVSANPLRPATTRVPTPKGSISPVSSECSSYRPYTPPSSPEGSCDMSMSMSMSKNVWRPW